jgi:hypothetical protein
MQLHPFSILWNPNLAMRFATDKRLERFATAYEVTAIWVGHDSMTHIR